VVCGKQKGKQVTQPPLDVPAIRAICEAATPGPWRANAENAYPWVSGPYDDNIDGDCTIVEWNETGSGAHADASFIAAARTALPAALDEIQRLRELLGEIYNIASVRECIGVHDEAPFCGCDRLRQIGEAEELP